MARLVLILLAVALTVFALADWLTRSKTWTPGKVNRWVWLAVILLLPIVGPLTWIIVGVVVRAEAKQQERIEPSPRSSLPPDDNPDAILDVADRIARRQKRSRPESPIKPKQSPEEDPKPLPHEEDDESDPRAAD